MSEQRYVALLCDRFDNHEYAVRKSYPDDDATWKHDVLFLWTEGNYGCDCNRGDFCELPGALSCNEDENRLVLMRLTLVETGEVLYDALPCVDAVLTAITLACRRGAEADFLAELERGQQCS